MSSEPQIARRCPSCGASIRASGDFCPQCGKPVPRKGSTSEPLSATETAEVINPADTLPLNLVGAETAELTNDYLVPNQGETMPLEPPAPRDEKTSRAATTASLAATQRLRSSGAPAETTGAVGRTRTAGETLGGNVLQGVGKLREISTVVDEAAYDPSLRFLLVAAVLFVLFLVILILSEVIT